jgi:hypothetical protein
MSGPGFAAGERTLTLADVLGAYGDRWQIERIESPAGYIAVRRLTPTAQHIVAGHDLYDLACKLEAVT